MYYPQQTKEQYSRRFSSKLRFRNQLSFRLLFFMSEYGTCYATLSGQGKTCHSQESKVNKNMDKCCMNFSLIFFSLYNSKAISAIVCGME
jgi:hypothetical protein